MKSWITLALLAWAPCTWGQQANTGNTANFTRPSVAVAPNQAGGAGVGQGGGQTGGISFVTRPESRATPILAAASFFAAGGVPVIPSSPSGVPGAGSGALAVAGVANPPASPDGGQTIQTLRALAAGGDRNARQALAVLGAGVARTAAKRGR